MNLNPLQIILSLISTQMLSETQTWLLFLVTLMHKQMDGTPWVKQLMNALELMVLLLDSDWNNLIIEPTHIIAESMVSNGKNHFKIWTSMAWLTYLIGLSKSIT